MSKFNLSALAVRERAITLFLIVAITLAGVLAFLKLGRAEDPSFTIKVLTVSAVWPGATAQEMQDLVAEPLEKRLQELKWYDRVEIAATLENPYAMPYETRPILLCHGRHGNLVKDWPWLKRWR